MKTVLCNVPRDEKKKTFDGMFTALYLFMKI